MKFWKIDDNKYAIKARLGRSLFRRVIGINGVEYNKSKWRIEFNQKGLAKSNDIFPETEIIKGEELLKRLYRISKFKSRKELMKYAVMLHESQEYIYMILTEQAFELLEEYEGKLLIYDSKVEEYAEELIYLNRREDFDLYSDKEDFSIKDLIKALDAKRGSILKQDTDSAPYLFLDGYKDLELSEEQKNKLFKEEIKVQNANAFNLENLAEEREINREVWLPILEEMITAEINRRVKRLDNILEDKELATVFKEDRVLKLASEIEALATKLDKELREVCQYEWIEYYQREKDRRIYGF